MTSAKGNWGDLGDHPNQLCPKFIKAIFEDVQKEPVVVLTACSANQMVFRSSREGELSKPMVPLRLLKKAVVKVSARRASLFGY